MRPAGSRGMALAIVVLLLLGLALLALAGSAAAVAALALAGLDQQQALAFEAAEAGIARTMRELAQGAPWPRPPTASITWPSLSDRVTTRIGILEDDVGSDGGWPAGFSIGVTEGFATRHLTIVAVGRADRKAAVRIEQDLAIIGPAARVSP